MGGLDEDTLYARTRVLLGIPLCRVKRPGRSVSYCSMAVRCVAPCCDLFYLLPWSLDAEGPGNRGQDVE